MKKKTSRSRAAKRSTRKISTRTKKGFFHKLFPLKFTLISVTVLGCLAIAAGGVYNLLPQHQADVLALTTGGGGGAKTISVQGTFKPYTFNTNNVILRATIQRVGSSSSNTINCKVTTHFVFIYCNWNYTFYVGYTYKITPSPYSWNADGTKRQSLLARSVEVIAYKPGLIKRFDQKVTPGQSITYVPLDKDSINKDAYMDIIWNK